MKILDLGEFYSERGGGVRSYLGGLLKAAENSGHEVVVLAPGPTDSDEAVPGGRIVRYRAPRMPYDGTYHLPLRVDLMRQLVKRIAPDVLQLSSPYLPWVAARNIQAPLKSYIYHSDPIGAYVQPAAKTLPGWLGRPLQKAAWGWMRAVCNSCDLVVVAGEWQRRDLEQAGIASIHCVPFGIQHRDFGPDRRSSKQRAELLGSDDDQALLLIAGRLAIEKRQAQLVRAAALVQRRRPVHLVILGDGPERERLQALCEAELPGRHHFIRFTQDRAQYAELLASADALLHGSRCETYGFVLVEALASGTPLVAPDAGAAGAVGTAAAVALYPADAGPAEIADATVELLGRGAPAREAAVAAAAQHVSTEEHFRRLFALYESRLRGGG